MFELLTYLLVFLLTYFGVGQFRRWSLKRKLFDVPNERSSHQNPTPRGGGLIIVLVCLIFYTVLAIFSRENFAWGYFIGAILVAFISWLDDLYTVSFVWRFLVHTAAACLLIANLGFWTEIHLPVFANVEFGYYGAIISFLWIVWLTNAYNFMDGIDGIAGMQAFTAGIGWLIVGKLFGMDSAAIYGGIVAFSAIGFLIHNWHPAKIFMGDVGSAFLGYTFAALPFIAKSENSENASNIPLIAVLLLWLFIFDTVFTFMRRLLKKQKVWTAHREHLYQRLVIAGKSHQFVAGLYGVLSLVMVFSIFLLVQTEKIYVTLLSLICLIEAIIIFLLNSVNKNVD
jgi:Fuc2NAc and GlcNAc transferase